MTPIGRPSRGFTLIELVLVMLVIGLLLSIVAPSLGGLLHSQRMDQSARTLSVLLMQARVQSASEAKPYRLAIDTDDNTCWIEALTPEGFERPMSSAGGIIELDSQLVIELDGGEQKGSHLYVRVEPDGVGELAQITLTRKDDGEQVAVYCKTPTEPYIIGAPVSPEQLEDGGDDVETNF